MTMESISSLEKAILNHGSGFVKTKSSKQKFFVQRVLIVAGKNF